MFYNYTIRKIQCVNVATIGKKMDDTMKDTPIVIRVLTQRSSFIHVFVVDSLRNQQGRYLF